MHLALNKTMLELRHAVLFHAFHRVLNAWATRVFLFVV